MTLLKEYISSMMFKRSEANDNVLEEKKALKLISKSN